MPPSLGDFKNDGPEHMIPSLTRTLTTRASFCAAVDHALKANCMKDAKVIDFQRNHVSMVLSSLQLLCATDLAGETPTVVDAGSRCVDLYSQRIIPELDRAAEAWWGPQDLDASPVTCDDDLYFRCLGDWGKSTVAGRYMMEQYRRLVDERVVTGTPLAAAERQAAMLMLHRYLVRGHPDVRGNVGNAAMHSLLRIAFALELGTAYEDVIYGLANLVSYALPAPVPRDMSPTHTSPTLENSVQQVLQSSIDHVLHLHEIGLARNCNIFEVDESITSKHKGIDGRIAAFFQAPDFQRIIPRIEVTRATAGEVLAAVKAAALTMFEEHHDFTALHVLTGSTALGTLLNALLATSVECGTSHDEHHWLSDLVSGAWAAILAIQGCMIQSQNHRRPEQRHHITFFTPGGPLSETVAMALTTASNGYSSGKMTSSSFEHLIKLTFACSKEASAAVGASAATTAARYKRLVRREVQALSLYA